MTDKPKFNFGDYIYHGYVEHTEKWSPCSSCSGRGYNTIVLDGETFTIDCEDCKRGYLGSNGSRGSYSFVPAVREGAISGVEKDSFEPFGFKYRLSAGSNSSWVLNEEDCFSTKEKALARAEVLKAEREKEDAARLLQKTKPDKSWVWHVRYYQNQIKFAQGTIERATEQLNAAKKHVKETKDVDAAH